MQTLTLHSPAIRTRVKFTVIGKHDDYTIAAERVDECCTEISTSKTNKSADRLEAIYRIETKTTLTIFLKPIFTIIIGL